MVDQGRRSRGADGADGARPSLGGWLSGPGGPREPGQGYPGEALGRPREGSGSVATLTRRGAALVVDWGLALLVGETLLPGLSSFAPLLVFAVAQVLLVATLGYGVGHRLLGLQVEGASVGPAGPLAVLVRTLLLLLVVPAVVIDDDGRGLHDRAAGTVVVRR